MLDPAADDVPSGLSQCLTGTNTGPLFPAGRREKTVKEKETAGEKRRREGRIEKRRKSNK